MKSTGDAMLDAIHQLNTAGYYEVFRGGQHIVFCNGSSHIYLDTSPTPSKTGRVSDISSCDCASYR